MSGGFIAASVCSVVFMLLSVAFAGIWVYKDARQRGLQAGLWTLLVVLSGNFIGLILYLAIGRKQSVSVCENCGSKITMQGDYCPACGGRNSMQAITVKTNKGWLISCIVCIALAFASLGMFIFFAFNGGSEGFIYQNQYSYYIYDSGGYAKKLSQNSAGDTWKMSFEEASEGYVFSKVYNAAARPISVLAEIDCDGSVQLIITQGGASVNETLKMGSYSFDMSGFETGKISFKLINIGSSVFSGEITVVTEGAE